MKYREGQVVSIRGIAYTVIDDRYDNEINLVICDEKQATRKYGVGGEYIIISENGLRDLEDK